MKNLVLLFLVCLCGKTIVAQTDLQTEIQAATTTTSYSYDASGNRLSKTIVIQANSPSPDNEEDENEEEQVLEKTMSVYSETIEEISVTIYPNPTKGKLTIEMKSAENLPQVNLSIYNTNGQCLYHNQIQHAESVSKTDIDISAHKSGVYVLKIETVKYSSEWKIIKQ